MGRNPLSYEIRRPCLELVVRNAVDVTESQFAAYAASLLSKIGEVKAAFAIVGHEVLFNWIY
jgi:hypothetical protein